jgi:hypothetical protein
LTAVKIRVAGDQRFSRNAVNFSGSEPIQSRRPGWKFGAYRYAPSKDQSKAARAAKRDSSRRCQLSAIADNAASDNQKFGIYNAAFYDWS